MGREATKMHPWVSLPPAAAVGSGEKVGESGNPQKQQSLQLLLSPTLQLFCPACHCWAGESTMAGWPGEWCLLCGLIAGCPCLATGFHKAPHGYVPVLGHPQTSPNNPE